MRKNPSVSAHTKRNVIHVNYNGGSTLDLVKTNLLLDAIEKEGNGDILPVVIDFSGLSYIDRESRTILFSKIVTKTAIVAFVVSNSQFKMLLNCAAETLIPQFYIKIFNTPVMAEKWINTALKEVVVLS